MNKEIKGKRETYIITSDGKVFTKEREYSHGGVKPKHFLKQTLNSNNYLRVSMTICNKRKNYLVHRLVAQAFIPNPNNLPQVNHKDGNKLNNCVENLEWCTKSENEKHAYKLGLKTINTYGEKHGMHKLTQKDVDYIRKVHKRNDVVFGTKALAEKFNVNPQTITNIVNNKNWCRRELPYVKEIRGEA